MARELTVTNVLIALSLLYVAYRFIRARRFEAALPPGPKGLPILGNAVGFPAAYTWLYFSRLRKQYGDIVSLNVLGQRMIIFSKRKDMIALTVKKHDNYANRPSFITWEASGWTEATAMHNGPEWKDHRRYMSRLFGTKQLMQKFYDLEIKENRKFLRNVLRDPDELDHHVRYLAGSIILKIAYGYEVKSDHDPFIEKVDRGMAEFADVLQPGNYMVDFIPILRFIPEWLPGGGWKKILRGYSQTTAEIMHEPLELVKQRMKAGTAVPCYVTDMLESEGDSLTPAKEYTIMMSAGSIYAGGADTSVSSVHGFFFIMMYHPDIQRKAQAEIEAVVGKDRLPDFSDRDNLPYVEAVFKELIRYHTVIPTGGPRRALKDDIHEGYLIPEGTTVISNLWEMCHDPDTYANPFEFNPDRFMGANPELHPKELFFGFGRRICPGQHLADVTTWISCATALAAFDIQRTKDSPPEISFAEGGSFTGNSITRPLPFKCSITARSAKYEALINTIELEL